MSDAGARIAFDIGRDFAAYGLTPPEHAPVAALHGYLAQAPGSQCKRHDRYVRKWLQLRCNAVLRRCHFASDVTPAYLRRIDAGLCPVTFESLTHGACTDSDWSVDRVLNSGGYAQGNLVIISTKANRAKDRFCSNTIGLAVRRSQMSLQGVYRGLTPKQWMRIGALLAGPAAVAANRPVYWPQCTLPPVDAPTQPLQVLQTALVFDARLPGQWPQRMLGDAERLGGKQGKWLLRKLKRRIDRCAPATPPAQWPVASPFDVWLDEGVFRDFLTWFALLPPAKVARIVAAGPFVPGKRCVAAAWALEQRGYID